MWEFWARFVEEIGPVPALKFLAVQPPRPWGDEDRGKLDEEFRFPL